ncbi:hypothetical protein ACEQ8H_003653 [Pleosporales sp. CAS-2024a]
MIALTLLSHYYQRLNDTELFVALTHLTNSDQAEITYQDWVKDSDGLTEASTTLKGERYVRQDKIWSATNKQDGQLQLIKDDAEKLLETEGRPKIFAISEDPFKASALQEEQERELSPEMEQERQIQRAPTAKPRKHGLHPDVQSFASTGNVISDSPGYCPAFSTLRSMSTATTFNPSHLSGTKTLLATTDFAETVVNNSNTYRDNIRSDTSSSA